MVLKAAPCASAEQHTPCACARGFGTAGTGRGSTNSARAHTFVTIAEMYGAQCSRGVEMATLFSQLSWGPRGSYAYCRKCLSELCNGVAVARLCKLVGDVHVELLYTLEILPELLVFVKRTQSRGTRACSAHSWSRTSNHVLRSLK